MSLIKKALIVAVILFLLFVAFMKAVNAQELYECNKWQDQADKHPAFYLSEWQEAQCLNHNIIIK